MTAANVTDHLNAASKGRGLAKRLVLLSGVFLLVQVASTDYGSTSTPAFWFVVGAVLLWFIYRRRSNLARQVTVVLSLVGAFLYAASALADPRAVILVLAYVGQAVPLMLPPVLGHVGKHSRT